MLSLSIDTSCAKSTLSIMRDDSVITTVEHHSNKLQTGFFTLIENVLNEHNIKPFDINRVYCGIGPGSFTGVRIGVSFAKTLCQLTGAELYSYHSCYAGIEEFEENSFYLAVTPSTKNECYAVLYQIDQFNSWREIHDVDDGSPDRILNWLETVDENSKLIIYGEGVSMVRDLKYPEKISVRFLDEHISLPNAERIFKVEREYPQLCIKSDPLVLKPLYVRPSPAETAKLKREMGDAVKG